MATIEKMQVGPRAGVLRDVHGELRTIPEGWALLEPGDPLVTRRVKATGPAWVVEEKVGRKVFSRGVYAPLSLIQKVRQAAERERADPRYAQKLEAGRQRREREQDAYVLQFEREVLAFLEFAPVHADLAAEMARRVSAHATPVGSGTVARTKRIEVHERAEAAVIAWMRHQTTAYDSMSIARVKGKRREVRRELAQRSRALLERYRKGLAVSADCPLQVALARKEGAGIAARVAERAAQVLASKPHVDEPKERLMREVVAEKVSQQTSVRSAAPSPVTKASPHLATKLQESPRMQPRASTSAGAQERAKQGSVSNRAVASPAAARARVSATIGPVTPRGSEGAETNTTLSGPSGHSSEEEQRRARMAAVRARLKR